MIKLFELKRKYKGNQNQNISSLISFLLVLLLIPLTIPKLSSAENSKPFLYISGNTTIVSMMIETERDKIWNILTDYKMMGEIMPDIKNTTISRNYDNKYWIEHVYQAPYTFGREVKALIEVVEDGYEIINYTLLDSKMIRRLRGNWILIPLEKGTLVTHRVDIEPIIPKILEPFFARRFHQKLINSMLSIKEKSLSDF